MPRLTPREPTEALQRDAVIDAEMREDVASTSLAVIESTAVEESGPALPTNLEQALYQWGAYQIPISLEERRLWLVAQSGLYRNCRTLGQAQALSDLARALGISEHEAFLGIHNIQGQLCFSAHLIGALVQRSKRFSYRVVEMSPDLCRIKWFENGEEMGESFFDIETARRNGWVNPKRGPWLTAPDEMLRNRSLAKGARTYCPSVFGGAVYSPEEIEDVTHIEGGTR